MAQYNGKDGKSVEAEQFGIEQLPWPKGVEDNKGIGGATFYSIATPTGDIRVQDGDFIITEGLDDTPDVVPYDVFMDTYAPVPDDV